MCAELFPVLLEMLVKLNALFLIQSSSVSRQNVSRYDVLHRLTGFDLRLQNLCMPVPVPRIRLDVQLQGSPVMVELR